MNTLLHTLSALDEPQPRNLRVYARVPQVDYDDDVDTTSPDYDGAPYCSYGHKTQAGCDCGEIASNE